MRRDAQPLTPAELIQFRRFLASAHGVEPQLSAGEVAKLLGYARRTVLDLARDGEFPGAWKPAHNQLRIPASSVRAFLERRQREAPAALAGSTGSVGLC